MGQKWLVAMFCTYGVKLKNHSWLFIYYCLMDMPCDWCILILACNKSSSKVKQGRESFLWVHLPVQMCRNILLESTGTLTPFWSQKERCHPNESPMTNSHSRRYIAHVIQWCLDLFQSCFQNFAEWSPTSTVTNQAWSTSICSSLTKPLSHQLATTGKITGFCWSKVSCLIPLIWGSFLL